MKGLLRKFSAVQVHYVSTCKNVVVDALASDGLKEAMVGAIQFQEP